VAVVVVRDAVRDDAAAILRVRARTWQSAYAHVFPQQALEAMSSESSISRRTAWWRDVIENAPPRSHAPIADVSGEVVGFAHLGATLDEAGDWARSFERCAIGSVSSPRPDTRAE